MSLPEIFYNLKIPLISLSVWQLCCMQKNFCIRKLKAINFIQNLHVPVHVFIRTYILTAKTKQLKRSTWLTDTTRTPSGLSRWSSTTKSWSSGTVVKTRAKKKSANKNEYFVNVKMNCVVVLSFSDWCILLKVLI